MRSSGHVAAGARTEIAPRGGFTIKKTGVLTKILAVAGATLTWLPILATLLISVVGSVAEGTLLVDYLMPAELFPLALVGGGLLLWAALRTRSRRSLIGGGLVVAVSMLMGGQALAVVTGLASGRIEATGWPWALVLASLAIYTLALVEIGVAGILLVRDALGRGSISLHGETPGL